MGVRLHKALGTCSVVQTELWAIYDGLKLAWQRGLRNILVESDNMAVVHVLNDMKSDFSALSLTRSIKVSCKESGM